MGEFFVPGDIVMFAVVTIDHAFNLLPCRLDLFHVPAGTARGIAYGNGNPLRFRITIGRRKNEQRTIINVSMVLFTPRNRIEAVGQIQPDKYIGLRGKY